MVDDVKDFLQSGIKFRMSDEARLRIRGNLNRASMELRYGRSRSKLWRTTGAVAASFAGLAAVWSLVTVLPGMSGKNQVTEPAKVTAKSNPNVSQTVKPSHVEELIPGQPDMGKKLTYTGLDNIRKVAKMRIVLPWIPSGYKMDAEYFVVTIQNAPDQFHSEIWLNPDDPSKPTYLVHQLPEDQTGPDHLMMEPADRLKHVKVDGVTVTETWPEKRNVHKYDLVIDGMHYEVRSYVKDGKDAFTAQDDVGAWKIIDSIIKNPKYLN